ncbi:MAG: mechanosensitive ion channel family protein [Halobacteriota archaeon]
MADPLQYLGPIAVNLNQILVTLAVIVGVVVVRRGIKRWRRQKEDSMGPMARLAISAAIAAVTAGGVFLVIATWGLSSALLGAYGNLDLGAQVANIVLSIVVLGGAYAVTDFLGQVIRELATEQESIGDHEREILYRSVQVCVYTIAVLIVLGLFTDNLGSLLVGAGFLGIVVGMAARQTLGSVIAGFVLMFSRPFEVGDWIVIDDNEGTVTDITIVNTRIESFDGEYVVIPNDVVSGTAITNRTRRGLLRIEVEVGVDFDVDPDTAAAVAREAVGGIDRVLEAPAPQVVHKRFGESAVVLGVRVWIDNPTARRRWRTRTAMISAIRSALEAEGIKIPFPQRELSARSEAGGVRHTAIDPRPREEPSSETTPRPDGGAS